MKERVQSRNKSSKTSLMINSSFTKTTTKCSVIRCLLNIDWFKLFNHDKNGNLIACFYSIFNAYGVVKPGILQIPGYFC